MRSRSPAWIWPTSANAARRGPSTWRSAHHIQTPEPAKQRGRSERDFPGARRFVVGRRQAESAFIAQSLSDLREVIADLTERLATTLVEDQDGIQQVGAQVERLRAATTTTSLETLRQEVIVVADLLARLMDQQGQRLRGQLIELDLKVAALSEELQEVKHESSLDPLTRVFNRGAFDGPSAACTGSTRSQRSHRRCCLPISTT